MKKALYDLKKAPRAWYARMDNYLLRLGFSKSIADPNLYIKVVHGEPVILLCVDDVLVTSVENLIQECKKQLVAEFDMKDLGIMHYHLGLEVWQKPREIYLGQGKYVIKMLQRYGMMGCKSMMTPMITNLKKLRSSESCLVDPTCYKQLIGSLVYLVNTRSDILFAKNVLSQFQMEPKHDHWIAAKHILGYLHGTIYICLRYTDNEIQLVGYTNLDWGASETDGKRTTSGCLNLGSHGGAKSKIQLL